MTTIFADELRAFVVRIFEAAGVNSIVAGRTAEHLVDANLAGVDSHGVMRVPDYIEMVQKGQMGREDRIEIVQDKEATVLLDAHYTFGQLTAWRGMEIAMHKARQFGIGIVSARNSAHIGRLGEYAEYMARQGMVGFVCCNLQGSGQRVAPWGGSEGRLSTNPFAWGVPTGNDPMVIDCSTASSAEGKIRVKMRRGEQVPAGWLLDWQGKPTTNPADLYGPPFGVIQTMGAHKGYGLSLIIEALAGALSGGGLSHSTEDIDDVQTAFTIIAIDIKWFSPVDDFTEKTDSLIAHMKTSKTVEPTGEVLVPNDPELRERKRRQANGITIEEDSWKRIVDTARSLGVSVPI